MGKNEPNDLVAAFDSAEGTELERGSDFWKPNAVGATLVGYYSSKKDGKYGPVAQIQTPEGKLIPLGLNAVLEDLLPATAVGSYVAIQYTGEMETVNGSMRVYRVKQMSKETAAALWKLSQDTSELPF